MIEGDKRFNQLVAEAKRTTLAKELNALLDEGYVERKVVDTKPPKSIYKITRDGRDFLRNQIKERFPKLEVEFQRLKLITPAKVKEFRKVL